MQPHFEKWSLNQLHTEKTGTKNEAQFAKSWAHSVGLHYQFFKDWFLRLKIAKRE